MRTNHFDGEVARRYDRDEAEMFTPEVLGPAVDLLAELAAGGPACEFAIGTGRVAVPLAARGVPVCGMDLSPAMLAELAAKAGAEAIRAIEGDFTTTRVPGTFRVVYLVFNTIQNVTTQDEQVQCFVNAADHLGPGGAFVVETGVPALRHLPPGETVRAFAVGAEHLGFDEFDTVRQGLVSHHYYLEADGRTVVGRTPFRYVWPSELDLMARIAGLTLEARWGHWDRRPFTAESTTHVSVWRRA